jgi:hypothetical protein
MIAKLIVPAAIGLAVLPDAPHSADLTAGALLLPPAGHSHDWSGKLKPVFIGGGDRGCN